MRRRPSRSREHRSPIRRPPDLAQGLVGHDPDRDREVDRARGWPHGDRQAAVRMVLPEIPRQPHRLLPEEEPVPAPEAGFAVGLPRARRRVPGTLERRRGPREEAREIGVVLPVEPRPVVETRTAPAGVVEVEPEGAYQVESCPRRHAEPPDRPRVLWNERLDENDVQRRSAVVGHEPESTDAVVVSPRLTFARGTTLLPLPAGCASSNSS